ncbi:type VI secretion system tube protein TssD [Cytophagaceae bacterium DM2B3-1]|uniref:Type VI secretion system tube protein TssD n=1 Tax=Xanthocytophaga flava TaxID=3048013 RepID=A0ABT7CIT6_9BACT|nr:type VI secretion system tube protein TssD [Xanthocytophaga flavus]MDJ1469691.1 type VI secretion system tube protein TssD [Xanthocytophaga flavus]MDJ1493639.1 type VI secretion system tube protein TssD [Xanthocytophaga flavus]
MAFQANAEWNGSKFVVENLRWGASRQIAADGMVSSGFQQGLVHLTVRVTEGDNTFEKAANNPHKPVDSIKINLKKATEDATLQKVELKNAYLVDVREEFDANNSSPLLITYTFSCQTLKVDSAEVTAATDWSKI